MAKNEKSSWDFDVLAYVQEQVKRYGTPVSDGSAEASNQTSQDGANWLYPYPGPPTSADIAMGMSILRRAIDLDWRRTGCMADLIRFAKVDLRKAGDTVIEVVNLSKKISKHLEEELPGGDWSIGTSSQRESINTAAVCAILLDMAGRYHEAHAVRFNALKHDSRDGTGMRHYIVAHALMVGDLKTVERWLKWAIKWDQARAFWDWAETLYGLLIGNDDALSIASRANQEEPHVARFLIAEDPPALDYSSMYIQAGSKLKQQFHASMLWRAWAAHPAERQWLKTVLPSLAKGDRHGH